MKKNKYFINITAALCSFVLFFSCQVDDDTPLTPEVGSTVISTVEFLDAGPTILYPRNSRLRLNTLNINNLSSVKYVASQTDASGTTSVLKEGVVSFSSGDMPYISLDIDTPVLDTIQITLSDAKSLFEPNFKVGENSSLELVYLPPATTEGVVAILANEDRNSANLWFGLSNFNANGVWQGPDYIGAINTYPRTLIIPFNGAANLVNGVFPNSADISPNILALNAFVQGTDLSNPLDISIFLIMPDGSSMNFTRAILTNTNFLDIPVVTVNSSNDPNNSGSRVYEFSAF